MQQHMWHFATDVLCKARRCRGHDGVRSSKKKTSFFEGDENNDFDVNTAPMTLRPIVKDGGATVVRVKDVE